MTNLSMAARTELATLKLKLSPLLSAEAGLADRLSGGVQVGALAKRRGGGVYVRTGWQTTMSVSGRKRRHSEENDSKGKEVQDGEQRTRDVIQKELEDISSLLYACREDVKALWAHAAVRSLIDKRKLRLQESAEQ